MELPPRQGFLPHANGPTGFSWIAFQDREQTAPFQSFTGQDGSDSTSNKVSKSFCAKGSRTQENKQDYVNNVPLMVNSAMFCRNG